MTKVDGGAGAGLVPSARAVEAVARGCASTALILAMQLTHVAASARGPAWPERLRALVVGAGGDPDTFVAHLTLARTRRRGPARCPFLAPGPWWTPGEVLLVASERDGAGPHYRPVHRVPLARPDA